MKISFKYKFIVSFVSIEIIFISLIVFFNFSSLNKLSHSLVNEKIETSSKLFSQIIQTPLIIYDLATLDNVSEKFVDLENVIAVKIFDKDNKLISYKNHRGYHYDNLVKKGVLIVSSNDKKFRLKNMPIIIKKAFFGKISIIYDTTNSFKTIQENRNLTFFLVLLEIFVSVIVAYIIGFRLTRALSSLTSFAKKIAENDQISIPSFKTSSDEITVLSKAIHLMQHKISQRSLALKQEKDFYTALIDHANSIILVMNPQGEIVLSNKRVESVIGYKQKQIEGKKIWDILSDKDMKNIFLNSSTSDYPNQYENIWLNKKGIKIPFSWSNSCIENKNGKIEYIIAIGTDISQRKKIQKEIDKYVKLIDEHVLISHTDIHGVPTSNSKAFYELTGYKDEEILAQGYSILRDPTTPKNVYENLWQTIKSGKTWSGELKNIAKDGHIYWVRTNIYPDFDDNGSIIGYYSIKEDITNKKMLEKLSITDGLTHLYNRRYFDEIFDKEINKTRRDKKIFCLLSLDVDNFKLYNDTYGHQEGDSVLISIAKVLKKTMKRGNDFAFRIRGEEFSATYAVDDEKNALSIAQTIRFLIEDEKIEHKLNEASPYVTVSIGVMFINFAINVSKQVDKDLLYKSTDDLLYIAKKMEKTRLLFKIFSLH